MIKIERSAPEYGGVLEAFVPATLVKMPVINQTLTNRDGEKTNWGLATVSIEYPNGDVKESQARMYENSVKNFAVGDAVIARTVVEGEYKGNAVIQLAGATKIDVDALGLEIEVSEPVATTN